MLSVQAEGKMVTKHGGKRLKERMGIPKKGAERQSEMALERGIPHSKMTGRLFKWVTQKAMSQVHKGNYYVYNNQLFIYKSGKLVTILPVPSNLLKLASSQLSRYQEELSKNG